MNFKPGVSVGLDNPMPVKLVAGTGPFKPGQSVSDSNPLPVSLIGGSDVSMPVLAFASAVSQAEGNSGITNFVFTLNLTRNGNTDAIPFIWTVQGTGSSPATPANFVNGWPSGSGIFASGETSKTITVPVVGNTTVEPDKTFLLTAAPTTISSMAATVIGTILNDDVVPYLNVSPDISKVEGNNGASIYSYRVASSAAVSVDTQVPYAFVFGNGITGDDFTGGVLPAPGYVTIPAGQVNSNYINVSVNGDTAFENDEVFTIVFSTPSGFVAGTRMSATGTILNDDSSAPAPAFVKQSITPSTGPVGTTYTARSSVTNGSVANGARQWRLTVNGVTSDIPGATGVTYTSTAGGTLTCVETATGPGGSTTSTGTGANTVALSTFHDDYTSQTVGQPGAGQNGWLEATDPGGPSPVIGLSGSTRFLNLGTSAGGGNVLPQTWFDHTQTVSTYHGQNAAIGFRFGWTDANGNSYLLIFSAQAGTVALYFGKPGAYGTALFTKDVYSLIGGKAGGNSFSYTLTDDVLDIKIGDVSSDGQSAAINLATVYTYTEVDTDRRAKLVAGGQMGPYGAAGPDAQLVLRYDASGYLAVTHEAPAVVGFHRYGSTNSVFTAGLAAVAAAPTDGTVQKFIVMAGDSLTQAAYSASGPLGLTNAFNTRSAKTVAQMMTARGYPTYDKGFFGVGNNGTSSNTDAQFFAPYFGNLPNTSTPRCELGSFGVFNNGAAAGGGYLTAGTGAGFIWRDEHCTKFRVPITNQVAGNLTFKVDGVVVGQSRAVTTDGTMAFVEVPAGAAGLHALTITSDTAGVVVNGVIPIDETSAAINLVVMGSSGSPTDNLVSEAQPCSWRKAIALVQPILVDCLIYDNDVRLASGNPAVGAGQMRANLLTLDGFCTAAGSDLLFVTPPPSGSGNGNDFSQWPPFNTQMKNAGVMTHRAVLSIADNKGGVFDPTYFNDSLTDPPNGFAHPSAAGQADIGTLRFGAYKLMTPSSFPDVVSGGGNPGVSLTTYANPAPQAIGTSGTSDLRTTAGGIWHDTKASESGQLAYAESDIVVDGGGYWQLGFAGKNPSNYCYLEAQGSQYGCLLWAVVNGTARILGSGFFQNYANTWPSTFRCEHVENAQGEPVGVRIRQNGSDLGTIGWDDLKARLGADWTDDWRYAQQRVAVGSGAGGYGSARLGQVDPQVRVMSRPVKQSSGRYRMLVGYTGSPTTFSARFKTIAGSGLSAFSSATVIQQVAPGQALVETPDAVSVTKVPTRLLGADMLIELRQDNQPTRVASGTITTTSKLILGIQCWQVGVQSFASNPWVSIPFWANRALGTYKQNSVNNYAGAAQKIDPSITPPDPLVDADGIPMSENILWNLCQPDVSGVEQEETWQGYTGNPAHDLTQGVGTITVTARGQKQIDGQTYEYQRYTYSFTNDISDPTTGINGPNNTTFERVKFPGSSPSNKPAKYDNRPTSMAKTELFHPTMVSLMQQLVTANVNGKPFLRLMEQLNTNGNVGSPRTWEQRTKIGDYESFYNYGDGIGPEAGVALARKVGMNPWLPWPRYCSLSYEDGLIGYILQLQTDYPTMDIAWEWGNENWNTQLANGGPTNVIMQRYVQRTGEAQKPEGGGAVFQRGKEAAFQFARIYDKMVAAGVDMTRIHGFLGCQTSSVDNWSDVHTYLASIGREDCYVGCAVAPYYFPALTRTNYTDAELETIMTNAMVGSVTNDAAFEARANRKGKRLVRYEGGFDTSACTVPANYVLQTIRKPFMKNATKAHLAGVHDLYAFYALAGGGWGAVNGVGLPNPIYDGLIEGAQAAV